MSDPKNMQSEPRKIHIPTLRLSSPVVPDIRVVVDGVRAGGGVGVAMAGH